MNFYEIDKMLKAEFASKKLEAESIAEKNLAKASGILSYAKINALLKDLIVESSKTKNHTISKKNKEQIALLRKQRSFILNSIGLTEADLLPKYECKKCGDTGMIGTKPCACYQKRRNEEIMKACGIVFDKNHSLADYSTKICDDAKQAKSLEKLKTFFLAWTNSFPNVTKQNILIVGATGVGKTYLTQCVAAEMFKKHHSVCFVSAFDMNNMLTKFHTTFSADKQSWIDPLLESDLLIIDDLGTEPITKNVTINYLYLVLSERARFKKSTIITTNLLPEAIMQRYGERIFSRLLDKSIGVAFEISGKDLRTP